MQGYPQTSRLEWSIALVLATLPWSSAVGQSNVIDAASPPRVPATALQARLPAPIFDECDGEFRVLTNTYKLLATANGVRFLVASSPSSLAVEVGFRLVEVRQGDQIVPLSPPRLERHESGCRLLHGALVEDWRCSDTAAEQSFYLAEPPGRGELRVRLALATALQVTDVEAGVQFGDPGRPAIGYGDVTVIDANGRRVDTRTEVVDGGLELVVPAAFAAAAHWPLCIDPIVSSLLPAGQTSDNVFNADIATQPGSGNSLVVFERRFSQFDTDIMVRQIDGSGQMGALTTIAIGSEESHNPSVGVCTGRFFVAWDEDRLFDRVILGRFTLGTLATSEFQFVVRDAAGETNVNPAVGGSKPSQVGGTTLLVVSEQGDNSMSYDLVDSQSPVTATPIGVRTGTQQRRPRLPRLRMDNRPWLVASERAGDIFLEAVTPTGFAPNPVLIVTPEEDRQPVIAGTDDRFLLAWIRVQPTTGIGKLAGRTVDLGTGSPVVSPIILDLRSGEPGGSTARDQSIPALGSDGVRYTVAYREEQANGILQPFAAVFGVSGTAVSFHDGHVPLSSANRPHGAIAIASRGEATVQSTRSRIVFDVAVTSSDRDVHFVDFDGVQPGPQVTFANTSCDGPASTNLTVSGQVLPGRAVQLTLGTTGVPMWLVGPPSFPVTTCGGQCTLGVGFPFVTLVGTPLDLALPSDPAVVGASLAIQGVGLGVLGGCDAAFLGIPFDVSRTAKLTVR